MKPAVIKHPAARLLPALLTPLLLLLLPLPAAAGSCTVSATPVVFGSYTSPGGSTTDSSGTISVTCTPDLIVAACSTGYSISLGTGSSGSYIQRRMSSGSNQLGYNLYSDSGRGVIWGDGNGAPLVSDTVNTSILGLVCLPGTRNTTVYGRIPASQNVAPGSYTDSITVTILF